MVVFGIKGGKESGDILCQLIFSRGGGPRRAGISYVS